MVPLQLVLFFIQKVVSKVGVSFGGTARLLPLSSVRCSWLLNLESYVAS